MVDRTALEMRRTGNRTGGSNPSLSASRLFWRALRATAPATIVTKVRDGKSAAITKLAFEFLILTAVRTKEVRGARWEEIDADAAIWRIPGEDDHGRRMKAGREHIVPLAPRCIEILNDAKALFAESELVFPDEQSGRMMSGNRF